jgi:hypothetical protein
MRATSPGSAGVHATVQSAADAGQSAGTTEITYQTIVIDSIRVAAGDVVALSATWDDTSSGGNVWIRNFQIFYDVVDFGGQSAVLQD